jgi:large subunit ribosomal protein L25
MGVKKFLELKNFLNYNSSARLQTFFLSCVIMTILLQTITRNPLDKIKNLRNNGKIPCVVYGQTTENISFLVDYQEFRKVFRSSSQHIPVNLEIEGKKIPVLVKSFDLDPIKDTFIHVDFYAPLKDKEVSVPVPVVFTGESPALRIGAILTVAMPKVQVSCLMENIHKELIADISTLKEDGDKICIGDISKPANITYVLGDNILVAKSEFPRATRAESSEEEEAGAEGGEQTEENAQADEQVPEQKES